MAPASAVMNSSQTPYSPSALTSQPGASCRLPGTRLQAGPLPGKAQLTDSPRNLGGWQADPTGPRHAGREKATRLRTLLLLEIEVKTKLLASSCLT